MSQAQYSEAEILDLIRAALNEVVPDRADDWTTVQLDRTIEELELDSIATMEMKDERKKGEESVARQRV